MNNTTSTTFGATVAFAVGAIFATAPVLAQTVDMAQIEAGGGNGGGRRQ